MKLTKNNHRSYCLPKIKISLKVLHSWQLLLEGIGMIFPDSAQEECEAYGASLPLPTSGAQNEDLRLVVQDMELNAMQIGVSDSG